MKRLTGIISLLVTVVTMQAATEKDTLQVYSSEKTISQDDPQVQAIDKVLVASYLNHFCFSTDKQLLNAHSYAEDQVPTFSPEVVSSRLSALDKNTPFDLVYNSTVQGFIDLYAVRRRDITAKVLGMSELYFPIFEEYLAKYEIPLEMKYLAIVESALNSNAISSAGAGGLWQFMVGTGKMYDLEVTSYQDERFDPYKATDAACQYLRFLYDTFGDWQLALAAYNSGPGNVNKAIRRSGGKRDFWEIKNYLPRETQGYVPAFIAVNYVMNYATEHNIYPKKPLTTFFETDSVTVNDKVNFATLSQIIDMPVEDIAFLNGTYKLKEVPKNGQRHYLILPVEKVGLFLANEGLVYEKCREKVMEPAPVLLASASSAPEEGGVKKTVWESTWKTHKVRKGETLGAIADKYNVSLAEIKKWNHVKGSVIHSGQSLKIQTKVKKTVVVPEENNTAENSNAAAEDENKEAVDNNTGDNATAANKPAVTHDKKTSSKGDYKYYTIQRGDTLYKIASKYDGVTVNSIKSLNSGLRENKLVVGQKIKIKQI